MFDHITLSYIRQGVVLLIALILSVAVHEFGHAFSADKLGDSTPRHQGRVTLNPLVHIDPLGTIIFPIVAFVTGLGLLGWGRPVIINPVAFTRRLRMKTGHLIVALAGPAMNVVMALVVTLLYAILLATRVLQPGDQVAGGIKLVIHLNWILCFFNLLPVPPLDGGAVLAGLLPDRLDHINRFLAQYGSFILIGLLVTGAFGVLLTPARYIAAFSAGLVEGIFGQPGGGLSLLLQ